MHIFFRFSEVFGPGVASFSLLVVTSESVVVRIVVGFAVSAGIGVVGNVVWAISSPHCMKAGLQFVFDGGVSAENTLFEILCKRMEKKQVCACFFNKVIK